MSLRYLDVFDPSRYYQLSQRVSLREEAFGALAYHHGNRRLVFLKSRELAELLGRLGEFDSARDAIQAIIEPDQRERYTVALASLWRSELLDGR